MNNLEIMQYLDRAKPISDIEHERWYANIVERSDSLFFAMETTDNPKHVGNIWLWSIDPRHRKAEVRIVIGESEQLGKGLGTEAINLLSAYAFSKLNLNKLYAFVLSSNPRGKRSFEKAGFQVEGTLRRDRWAKSHYVDVYVLGKLSMLS